jgi:hypothetical protein
MTNERGMDKTPGWNVKVWTVSLKSSKAEPTIGSEAH